MATIVSPLTSYDCLMEPVKLDMQRGRRIFRKLLQLGPDLERVLLHSKSSVPGSLDLHLDVLECSPLYRRIMLGSYWSHPSNGAIPDPSMTIAVFFDLESAEALTYKDVERYEVAYTAADEPPDLKTHTRLNVFLERWLTALLQQGHAFRRGARNTT